MPARDRLHILLDKEAIGAPLFILNAQGQEVESLLVSSATMDMDLSGLPSGVYLLELVTGQEPLRTRFMKE